METCPRGCDAIMQYIGIDDGFGEDGDLVCDIYECPSCGEQVVRDCLPSSLFEAMQIHYKIEYSFECSMCGKDMPASKTGRCSSCEQVWNG